MQKKIIKQGNVSKKSFLTRYIQHPIEAFFVFIIYGFLAILPIDIASYLGGLLARTLGPLIKKDKLARKNLKIAYPDISEKELSKIIKNMWDNLGRSVAEMPHNVKLIENKDKRIEFVGLENLEQFKKEKKAAIALSGHFANWEMFASAYKAVDLPVHRVYRAANNPFVEKNIFARFRTGIKGKLIPKGAPGAREILRELKKQEHIGIMGDQKLNDGISVPFFGKEAMTTPSPVSLALKFNCPIYMIRMIRKKGANFIVEIDKPFYIKNTNQRQKDIYDNTLMINKKLEKWITEHKDQWLWIHNRWPKK